MDMGVPVVLVFVVFAIITAIKTVVITPQSSEYVIERFGKYTVTFGAGINLIVPYLDRIAHKVVILERQLDAFPVSVFTADNVEIELSTTTFFRVTDSAKSVYRIRDLANALRTTAESIIRSSAGKMELDQLQSSREKMNVEILENLRGACEVWGVEITRTEILDVKVDTATKEAQREQLIAERKRRATVAQAQGERERVQLEADGELYEAQKKAEALRITADAEAYSIEKTADAVAAQTRKIAAAINEGGQSAINYDIAQRQVAAISDLAAAENTKTMVLPTNVTETLGALTALTEMGKNGN